MVSTVWSVSCLLFFYSRCPPCPAICKSGGTCPPCPMESALLYMCACVAYECVRARARARVCVCVILRTLMLSASPQDVDGFRKFGNFFVFSGFLYASALCKSSQANFRVLNIIHGHSRELTQLKKILRVHNNTMLIAYTAKFCVTCEEWRTRNSSNTENAAR